MLYIYFYSNEKTRKVHYSEAKVMLNVVLPSVLLLLARLWTDSVIFFGNIKLSLFSQVMRKGCIPLSVERGEILIAGVNLL